MTDVRLSQRLYARLIRADDTHNNPPAHLPHNFLCLALAQLGSKVADELMNPKVVLAWLFGAVGAPVYLIGWLVPIRESGSLLPQIGLSRWIGSCHRRKGWLIAASLLQGVCILAMMLVIWGLDGTKAGYGILVCLLLFSLARAINSIASKDIIAATIPQGQRGQLGGWAGSVGGIVTLLAGLFFWLYSGDLHTGHYLALLFIAAGAWCFTAVAFGAVNEPEMTQATDKQVFSLASYRQLLWSDRVLQQLLLTRTLLMAVALFPPYLIVLAQQAEGQKGLLLGQFIVAGALAAMFSSPLLGRLADRSSRRLMLYGALLVMLVLLPVAVLVTFWPGWSAWSGLIPVLYFLVMMAHAGVRLGRKTYLLDIAEGDRRTQYVALSNTLMGVMLMVLGLISSLISALDVGWLMLVFAVMAGLAALSAACLPEVNKS